MVVQVVISQFFVWCAILTERQKFYFYEEVGWGVIFIFYTAASAILYGTSDSPNSWELLLELNLLFGVLYLPWQFFHLKVLRLRAKSQKINEDLHAGISWSLLKKGLFQSIQVKKLTTRPKAWGGVMGMTWMIGYFAAVIPVWIYMILRTV